MKDIFKVHNVDARKIGTIVKEPIVDVTITSPPYFNLKDYGYKNQIGFGQKYNEYLEDLRLVFEQVFDITKDSGTLWVIIDTFRKDGEVVPLPFDFSNKISEVGWKLQEVIIWGKDRTVPWAHKGQMRSLFEYVLLFSKTKNYNFNIDKVRDFQSLKKWWVKYPERYNPKGKTPEAIWNFDIPMQGSWGKGYIKHFCPLPEDMIAQMLKITTEENDVVLDCFSGSGAVLSKADNMKRRYIGFELNEDYISMFNNYLKETGKQKRKEYELEEKGSMEQNKFQKLILDLRALKFARLFYRKLKAEGLDEIIKIHVERSQATPQKVNSLFVIQYDVLVKSISQKNRIETFLNHAISKAPLSKFGIDPRFRFISNINDFYDLLSNKKLYSYTTQVTHKFKKEFVLEELIDLPKSDIIISRIKVNLDEKDYE
ncbi:DNA-methyltransferase [Belliella marina]|uniref:Methyltransferase n=1 Tax=Belliella marina TaxID=1644146 RepID=A0ABW4VQN3_9BACT